jgi:hypothetical protein
MKIPAEIRLFGNPDFRGKCPMEQAEQVTFFNRIRRQWPDTWGLIAVHPRNEGARTMHQASRERSEGMTTGASDIIIPGAPSFVCELKRRNPTLSSLKKEQEAFLLAAHRAGAFVCIALGVDAAMEAFHAYLEDHGTRHGGKDGVG